MNTHIKRLDVAINRLISVRSTIHENFDVEFGIDHMIAVVEVAVSALDTEVQDELEDA